MALVKGRGARWPDWWHRIAARPLVRPALELFEGAKIVFMCG